eukprot:TRINITY_DN57452_c0_g1_i1.p1 TRINITY_DN57452_c0_g1~~TRINITY_DN57452_c0_g1_i1.p1  ORF type:complete len:524 (-),score=88.54 TRINITY_DN57452_c0_g1_i1:58-1557(-)
MMALRVSVFVVLALFCHLVVGIQYAPAPESMFGNVAKAKSGHRGKRSQSKLSLGLTVQLNERGYHRVLKSNSKIAMKAFILRLLDKADMTVNDEDLPLLDTFIERVVRTKRFHSLPQLKDALFLKRWIVSKMKAVSATVVESIHSIAEKMKSMMNKKGGKGMTAKAHVTRSAPHAKTVANHDVDSASHVPPNVASHTAHGNASSQSGVHKANAATHGGKSTPTGKSSGASVQHKEEQHASKESAPGKSDHKSAAMAPAQATKKPVPAPVETSAAHADSAASQEPPADSDDLDRIVKEIMSMPRDSSEESSNPVITSAAPAAEVPNAHKAADTETKPSVPSPEVVEEHDPPADSPAESIEQELKKALKSFQAPVIAEEEEKRAAEIAKVKASEHPSSNEVHQTSVTKAPPAPVGHPEQHVKPISIASPASKAEKKPIAPVKKSIAKPGNVDSASKAVKRPKAMPPGHPVVKKMSARSGVAPRNALLVAVSALVASALALV